MLTKHFFTLLFLVLGTCLLAQPTSKIALANLEPSTTVEGTKAGQIPITNANGVLRYGQFVEIEPTPLAFNPTSTGNSSNLSEFVIGANGFLYYIDWQGRAVQITSSGSSVNTSGVITGNGTIGTPVKLSDGTSTGQTLIWNGSAWTISAPANQSLTVTDGTNSENLSGQTLEFRGVGAVNNPVYNPVDNSITFSITEGDADPSNEGSLFVGAGTGTTSLIQSTTAGSSPITISNGGGLLLNENVGTRTITITAIDQSNTNEGMLSVASGNVNDANIISNSGTFVTIEGSPSISVTENTGANTITLAASLQNGNIYVGNASNVATGVSMSGDATITNTGVVTVDKVDNTQVVATGASDGQVLKWSNTNSRWEPSTDNIGGAGSTDLSIMNRTSTTLDVASSSGIDATIPAATTSLAGLLTATDATKLSHITVTQSVDLDAIEAASHSPVTVTDNSFIDFTLTGQNVTAALAQNGATTNQVIKWNGSAWAPANDAGTTYTAGTGIDVTGTVITNTAPDQTVTLNQAGIISVTGTYPNFTIQGSEVDGSTTNEGSLFVSAGTSTTSVINSNTPGSFPITISNGGGLLLNENTSTHTITFTALDQSNINEGMLSVNSAGSNESYISSNSGTFITLSGARGMSVTEDEGTDIITLTNSLDFFQEKFTATSNQTSFTLVNTPASVSGLKAPVKVFRNGVELEYVASAPNELQFSYSGSVVTTFANPTGTKITVSYLN